jgi:F-type H+-transporting ATPase subunit a
VHEISIRAETLFTIGSFPVTNTLTLAILALAVLTVVAFFVWLLRSRVPHRLQGAVELLLEEILKFMEAVLGSRHLAERHLPLIATIFLFILTSNWLGLLPGVGTIGLTERAAGHGGGQGFTALFRAPASDLNFTLALALISVIGVNAIAVGALGLKRHAAKFFTLKPSPIYTFTGILEFISEFVKIISFSFRLFGNVFAGEVLLAIIAFLIPFVIPLPFLFLEVFVGFIQAFIFSMLTLVFIAMATAEETAH